MLSNTIKKTLDIWESISETTTKCQTISAMYHQFRPIEYDVGDYTEIVWEFVVGKQVLRENFKHEIMTTVIPNVHFKYSSLF